MAPDAMNDPVIRSFLERCRSLGGKIKTVYLFGSRAKGTERPDSDYDLLLIVDDAFSLSDKDALYDEVIDILLESGRLVSLKIFQEPAFRRLRKMQTPFTTHVVREGIKLG